ncbi:MAG TPA: hypothetical protein VJ964_01270 [Balneolaceae bacterium]|nr:hypothetical protein [Balneolaceae bacterium]
MGQQQLLITILVTIIIGVATVIAINTMQASRTKANESAVRQDMLMVINDAHIYYRKPKALGGGGKSFDGISGDDIVSIDTTNENGTYEISGSGNTVTVDGTGTADGVSLEAKATISSNALNITWSKPSN